MAVTRDVIGQAETFNRSDRIVLDMDSSESPVHGQQEGIVTNLPRPNRAVVRFHQRRATVSWWCRQLTHFCNPGCNPDLSCAQEVSRSNVDLCRRHAVEHGAKMLGARLSNCL
jgi:hypothetical protein